MYEQYFAVEWRLWQLKLKKLYIYAGWCRHACSPHSHSSHWILDELRREPERWIGASLNM